MFVLIWSNIFRKTASELFPDFIEFLFVHNVMYNVHIYTHTKIQIHIDRVLQFPPVGVNQWQVLLIFPPSTVNILNIR